MPVSQQKSDSDTERQLACLLEDTPDVLKWLKLNDDRAKSIFTLRYTDPDTRELKDIVLILLLKLQMPNILLKLRLAIK